MSMARHRAAGETPETAAIEFALSEPSSFWDEGFGLDVDFIEVTEV